MGRKGRVVLGMALLGLGAWSVVPDLIHPTSTDAVVNAEVVTVRAPVDGQLAARFGLAVGDRVGLGEEVARVHAMRPETGRRDGLRLELAGQRKLAEALGAEEAELARLDHDLAGRGKAYRNAANQRLALSRTEAEAKLKTSEAARAVTRAKLAIKQSLLAKDLVAPAAVDAVKAEDQAAASEIESARAALARINSEAKAVGRGAFVMGGGDDSSYADQRRDEIRVKRAARKVEIAQAEIRAAELARQLAVEEDLAARLSDAVLAAPVSGVVWQRFAAEGDAVRSGDAVVGVVDCDRLFLTAVLPKRYFSELKAGDRAQARLAGTDTPVQAVVQSVRAAGSAQANTAAAVAPLAEEGADVVVTLAVHDAKLGNRSDNLCQVGQRATVTFRMPALKPLVDAVATGIRAGGHAS
ncbi:MAG: HlyD family efflux transporter periplasmic adaptor subunit [Rhodospirillaceae bacterium]|nr:HlyD family efflux transporter periplasmic adaptor subunit [Rhodospirillales bacterium]